MEYDTVTILTNAGAADYIPNFARHHISIETLIQMSDDDLTRVRSVSAHLAITTTAAEISSSRLVLLDNRK